MPFQIVRNDIVKMHVDAVVNAANTELKPGGGVCGAIFAAAGTEKLQEECERIGKCGEGSAVITRGYDLPARYIIHTVGPVWQGGNRDEERILSDCYKKSLELALRYKCKSVAFPLIASGVHGYPRDKALQTAVSAIAEFLYAHEMEVYLAVYDRKAFELSEGLFSSIEKYIDDNYVEERRHFDYGRSVRQFEQRIQRAEDSCTFPAAFAPMPVPKGKRSLADVVKELDESFSQRLLRMIDEKGFTDVEVYKRANIDRKLFSKIRSIKSYNPGKQTAIALAIALKLNMDETRDLLGRAGYTLSRSSKSDIIIAYFIEEGNYDIFQINEALFAFGQAILGA